MIQKINGIIAAAHTPMHEDFSVNYSVVPSQYELLKNSGLAGVFICGTTGEGLSLSIDERLELAETWKKCIGSDTSFKLIIHVGHNSLRDIITLASHAQSIGADAISSMAPTFFKVDSVETLVDFCANISSSAPSLPFYYYHIPGMTGVNFPMFDFLECAFDKIGQLAGIKYTDQNLMDFRRCIEFKNNRYDMLWGVDEVLLSALAMGAKGGVGSTYNFIPSLYLEIIHAFENNDLQKAIELQSLSIDMISRFNKYHGSVSATKAVMKMSGVDCGPCRPPLCSLSNQEYRTFKDTLKNILELNKSLLVA